MAKASGAFAQSVAFGKADAEWDRLFSNELLGRECPQERKRRRADDIPNSGVLNDANVKTQVAEAQSPLPEIVVLLGRLSTEERVRWINNVNRIALARDVLEGCKVERTVYSFSNSAWKAFA